jgi:hypothetical protein
MHCAASFGFVGRDFVGNYQDYCVGFNTVSTVRVANHFTLAGIMALFGLGG